MSSGLGFPLSLVDGRGRTLALAAAPKRVVSLVPSLTELLSDLELDETVVGVTRYCIHPEGMLPGEGLWRVGRCALFLNPVRRVVLDPNPALLRSTP